MKTLLLAALLLLLCAQPGLASTVTCGPLAMSLPADWLIADGPTDAADGMCYVTVGAKDDTSAVTLGVGPKGRLNLEQHADIVQKYFPARNPAERVEGRYIFPFMQNGVTGTCTVSEDQDHFLFVCIFGHQKKAEAVVNTFASKEYPGLLKK